MADADSSFTLTLRDGVAGCDAAAWDALSGGHPFASHAFLALLEESGSVGKGTGWQALPLLLHDAAGTLRGAVAAYAKAHSQGEYVFDHSWADAWERAGGDYYPKLQIAAPFTPVPGPRLLAQEDGSRRALITGIEQLVRDNGLSSAHATFLTDPDRRQFEAAGWLIRQGHQFHWRDEGYGDFDGFLGALTSRRRKAIRKERATAHGAVTIAAKTGADISPADWDLMWACYQDTGARKWGRPYLTRRAFELIGERMAERVVLMTAHDRRSGEGVAAALNFIGKDALYGRYWGALIEVPALHFELCYYQAIDWALAHGLSRVEAGAQGEHKLARGYCAVPTWSAHYIPHAGFRDAVAEFLTAERAAEAEMLRLYAEETPFRESDQAA